MAQRSNYWSCSAFAGWLRGTKKPSAETAEGWDEWHKASKGLYPIRYWLAEEGLDHLQNFLWWPIDRIYDVKYYVNNRWVSRTHALTAHPRDIKPGTWCDVGHRFLPCLFNELVDFVEVELAWWHLAWEGKEVRKKYNMPWWAVGWFRVRTWRCTQAGLDNLNWQMSLTVDSSWGVQPGHKDWGKPTHQAKRAKEIYDLYIWWTQTRPARLDPYDASGWSEICERVREANGGGAMAGLAGPKDPVLRQEQDQAHKIVQQLEEQYEKEDEKMMIRLIKARGSLWT
jgi:hypothetical protein